MPPKVVKRGAAAKRARVSSKAAIENNQQQQQQQSEPEAAEVVMKSHEENPVSDVVDEEKPVDHVNNWAPEAVPNGLAVVESKSYFLSYIYIFDDFCGFFSF